MLQWKLLKKQKRETLKYKESNMALLKLENVSKFYKTETSVAVGMQKVNLEFNIGEFVAVTGESGSGKSTLLNVVSGLDSYEDGEVYVNGEETSHFTISEWENFRNANIGFIFQNYNIIDSYTVLQNVMLALELQGYNKRERKQRALELIEKVGLKTHLHHRASKLSGGQKQRCVIARALAKDCPILVADEPTGNLDSKSGNSVLKLLHEISKNKLVLLVTHNYEQAAPYVTRKIKMHDGQVVEDKVLTTHNSETPVEGAMQQNNGLATQKPNNIPPFTMFKMALRDIFATPKRFSFSLIVQVVIMAALVLIYTSQMMSIRTIYNNFAVQAFEFQTRNNIILQKFNNEEFTQDEMNELKNLNDVLNIVPYLSVFEDDIIWMAENDNYSITHSGGITQDMLVEGRVPAGANEVLISSGSSVNHLLNKAITVTASSRTYSPVTKTYSVTVVGIVRSEMTNSYNSTMYVSQEILNNAELAMLGHVGSIDDLTLRGENGEDDFTSTFSRYQFIIVKSLPTNTVAVFPEYFYYNSFLEEEDSDFFLDVTTPNGIVTNTVSVANAADFGLSANNYDIFGLFVSEDYFYSLIPHFVKTNTITLVVTDYYAATQILPKLNHDELRIYYPYTISNIFTELSVFFNSFIAVVVLTVVGLFGYAIVHWLLKNMMQSKKKDLAIFRSMGATQKLLAWLVVLEQFIIGFLCVAVTLTGLFVLSQTLPSVAYRLRFIYLSDYVVLFVALLSFSTLLGFKFNKNIFKQSVIQTLNS